MLIFSTLVHPSTRRKVHAPCLSPYRCTPSKAMALLGASAVATLCGCWCQFKHVKNADIEISVLNQKHHAYKSGFSNTLPKCRCEVLLVYYIKIGSLDTNASAKSVCSHLWPEGTASWAGMLFWRNKELIAESLAVSQLCRRGRVVKSKSWS